MGVCLCVLDGRLFRGLAKFAPSQEEGGAASSELAVFTSTAHVQDKVCCAGGACRVNSDQVEIGTPSCGIGFSQAFQGGN